MFQNLKNYFFEKRINEDLTKNTHAKVLKNLSEINSIGVVFDGTSFQSINAIHEFELQLKKLGKSVEIYGYIDTNDTKQEKFLISNKNLNWYGYPTKKELFDFSNKPFDVLFGIFYDLNSPLNAIFANSKSKLRIGPVFNQNENLFDILIGISKGLNTLTIIKVLTNFLNTVKTK